MLRAYVYVCFRPSSTGPWCRRWMSGCSSTKNPTNRRKRHRWIVCAPHCCYCFVVRPHQLLPHRIQPKDTNILFCLTEHSEKHLLHTILQLSIYHWSNISLSISIVVRAGCPWWGGKCLSPASKGSRAFRHNLEVPTRARRWWLRLRGQHQWEWPGRWAGGAPCGAEAWGSLRRSQAWTFVPLRNYACDARAAGVVEHVE